MTASRVPDAPVPPVMPPPAIGIWRKTATLYLLTLCTMAMLATLALVLVYLSRPHQDNTSIVATILGFMGSAVPALMALIKGAENSERIQEVHIAINSRLDEFLKQASALGQAQGRAERAG